MVGAGGLEPPHGGSKGRCLTSLATPQDQPLAANRHPAWQRPNGGRSDYPAFGETATRVQIGAGKAASARARAAAAAFGKMPNKVGPLPESATARAPRARKR